MKHLLLVCLFSFFLPFASSASEADVTAEYPELKKYLYQEPKSNFKTGFGFNPVGIMNNRIFVSVNVFELHWIQDVWDIEIFSAKMGFGFSKESFSGSKHFSLGFSPRIKLFKFVSIGPTVGYEFVSFPDVRARITKNLKVSPYEAFSSRGLVYGIGFSESLSTQDAYIITLHQSVYNQTYSTKETFDGWNYDYENPTIQNDPERSPIKPSLVFQFGVSLLF